MRISIERIPATEEVMECLTNEEQRDALDKMGPFRSASITKRVKEADEEFLKALRILMALPEIKGQPAQIGFI